MNGNNGMDEAARLWAIRVRDSSFDDWEGFTAWLEDDPAHLACYEQALDDADWAQDLFLTQPPVLDASDNDMPTPRRRWLLPAIGGALAASLAMLATWTMVGRDGTQHIATAPGEHRTVELADGSRVTMNGGTRISFDPGTPREIKLAQGEALFTVRHDAARPFLVDAGGTRLLDAGTVFNVVTHDGAMRVAVAEGAVIYEPGPGQVRLNPGDALALAARGARPAISRVSPQAVGSWQQRQLLYDNAPLDEIAQDLARNIGRPVRLAAGARDGTRFTGTLMIGDTPQQTLERAAPLLGVTFQADGDAWTMTPAHVMSH